MSNDDGTWLHTDYETEGALALEMTVEQLRKVTNEPYRWKWVITSLHNAVQAFLVKACSGSDLLGAMTRKYRDHWYEQYAKGQNPTQPERLATVQELA